MKKWGALAVEKKRGEEGSERFADEKGKMRGGGHSAARPNMSGKNHAFSVM